MAGEHVINESTAMGTGMSGLGVIADAVAALDGAGDGNQYLVTDPTDEIALRARSWYLQAIHHDLWKNYRRDAKEDMGFYIGGEGQWSKNGSLEDYKHLIATKRVVVSINHCQAVVDVLTGYERQNRSDLKAAPQGEEDDDSARLMSWFLKFEQDQCQCQERISEMFEDGVITGMDCIEVGISYNEDPTTGRITMQRWRPGEDLIWDPYFTEYDGSDARFFLKPRWAFVLDLEAEFPEHKKAIQTALFQINQLLDLAPSSVTSSGPRSDAYGSVRNHPIEDLSTVPEFYNRDDQMLLVLEVWYRIYETEWLVIDKVTGDMTKAESAAAAHDIVKGNPDNLKAVSRKVRKVRMSTILPATFQALEVDQNPYPNDDEHYPFALFIAKRKLDVIYGIIRNLKDPQRIENKRWSQILDILGRFVNLRPLVPKGSLVNPRALDNPDDTSPILYDAEQGKGPPTWFVPPLAELARVLTEVALQMKVNMREVSGVNTDLLGIRGDDASGIAIARRQAQGQVIATLFFDNLRRTRKYIGQRLAKRIQQVYTRERVVRLTNDYGEPVLVRVNPAEFRITDELKADKKKMREQWREFVAKQAQEAGKPQVLRQVDSLEFDVVITDAPTSPTARAQVRQELIDMVKSLPEVYGPILLPSILEMSDFPGRGKVLAKIRALETAGVPPGGPGGPGTPPAPGLVPTAPPAPDPTPPAAVTAA